MDEGEGVCQVEDSLPLVLKWGRDTVKDSGFRVRGHAMTKNAKNKLTIFHRQHGHVLLPRTIELYVYIGALIRGVMLVVAYDGFIIILLYTASFFFHAQLIYSCWLSTTNILTALINLKHLYLQIDILPDGYLVQHCLTLQFIKL